MLIHFSYGPKNQGDGASWDAEGVKPVEMSRFFLFSSALGWSYQVATLGKTHQAGSLNFIQQGSGMSDTLAMARHFLQDYLKMKCCEQEALILNSALMQSLDH